MIPAKYQPIDSVVSGIMLALAPHHVCMDLWMASLTKSDLGSLVHHGHLDGAPIREDEGQVLRVGELELFLPDAPEGHRVYQGQLQPVAPPQGLRLGLA